MSDTKIIPTSSNGFKIEIYRWTGQDKDELVGTLELHTDEKSLHILRRENSFQKFKVTTTVYEKGAGPQEIIVAETNNLIIEL